MVFKSIQLETSGTFSLIHGYTAFTDLPQTFTLISADDCASSRAECIKLLESFGASVILEDADGWGVLKCRIDEIRGDFSLHSTSYRHADDS
jgi:hypothetical protein